MIDSRFLKDLRPAVRAKAVEFLNLYPEPGLTILVTSTLRDAEAQDWIYAQGRTRPGPIVTNAKAGQSFHNFGVAFDIVPMSYGKCLWATHDPVTGQLYPYWHKVGSIAARVGLEWAGNWKTFREYAHLQFTGGKTLADYQKGA